MTRSLPSFFAASASSMTAAIACEDSRGGQDAFRFEEQRRGVEDLLLRVGHGFDNPFADQVADQRGHAHAVSTVVAQVALGEGGAGLGLDGDEPDRLPVLQVSPDEGEGDPREIGPAADATDDRVRLGAGSITLNITDRRAATFKDVLNDPGRSARLSTSGFLLNLGLGAEKFIGLGSGGRGEGGLVIGVRAGYTFAPVKGGWELEKMEIAGGPGTAFAGPYTRLIIGAGNS